MKFFTFIGIIFCSILAAHENKIIVIIPSYNNASYCEKNILSALTQQYENYSIIYINDCSPDATLEKIQFFKREYDVHNRIAIIENQERQGALCNLYHAIHSCPDNVIIVTLDGDDFFANDKVLQRINHEYETKNIWMTWGQYKTTENSIGNCRPIDISLIRSGKLRSLRMCMSHPRTFYAGLFKQIKKEDLLYQGEFFEAAWDVAMMVPMLEMAEERHSFISDILYIYNMDNPINDYKQKLNKLLFLEKIIRSRMPYKRIENF